MNYRLIEDSFGRKVWAALVYTDGKPEEKKLRLGRKLVLDPDDFSLGDEIMCSNLSKLMQRPMKEQLKTIYALFKKK